MPAAEWDRFAAFVRLAFSSRRKTVRNALAGRWGRRRAAGVIAAAGLAPGARAGELELSRFVRLHREAAARGLEAVP